MPAERTFARVVSTKTPGADDAQPLEPVRRFSTGASRDLDDAKPDYSGYLSPVVLRRFGEYMLKNQTLADGSKRSSDNWKKGMPRRVYLASLIRHVLEVWSHHEDEVWSEFLEEALCGVLFNAQGYLLEVLKDRSIPPLLTAAVLSTTASLDAKPSVGERAREVE